MNDLTPAVVERYLQAEHDGDVDALAGCFTAGGGVNDEGRTHVGTEAIRAWRTGASSAYEYTAEVTARTPLGSQAYRITQHLEGTFPGGTADLDHLFALDGDRIAFLFITASR
jgi:hypothetical protein